MNCKKYIIWIFIGIIALSPQNIFAQGMSFSADVSERKVGVNDIFQLSFTLNNAPGNTQYKVPVFNDFIVRQGPIQLREQFSTVKLIYVLQPKRVGKFKIDPLEIIIDDEHYFTNKVNVEVVKGSVSQKQARQQSRQQRSMDPFEDFDDPFFQRQNQAMQQMMQQMQQLQQMLMGGGNFPESMIEPPRRQDLSDFEQKNLHKNIFIKVEVDNTKPYIGQQINAEYKLYSRLTMNMELTQLPILNGFWTEDYKLENVSKSTIEMVDGRPFKVFVLKKSALFPRKAGKLVLDPAKADGVVQVLGEYGPVDLRTSVVSKPITIDVQELPKLNQPKSFTGAVGEFNITSSLDSNIISTDFGTMLHFVISGYGNFKLIEAPISNFSERLGISEPQISDTILQRAPKITGEKSFNYFLNPQLAGNYEIPGFEFSYFNPTTKEYLTLKTEPLNLKVIQGDNNTNSEIGIPQDIHPILTSKLPVTSTNYDLLAQPWYWSLYLLGLLGLSGLLFFNVKQKNNQLNPATNKHKKANTIAWKRLASARKLLNTKEHIVFYEEISKAIWMYLSDKLSLPLSVLSKENIAQKLAEKKVPAETIEKVNQLLSECEMALYSPNGALQQKQYTLDHAADLIAVLESDLKKK